jgi:hypothetical protein
LWITATCGLSAAIVKRFSLASLIVNYTRFNAILLCVTRPNRAIHSRAAAAPKRAPGQRESRLISLLATRKQGAYEAAL